MRVIEIEWVDIGPKFYFDEDDEEGFMKAINFFTMEFSYTVRVYREEDKTNEA